MNEEKMGAPKRGGERNRGIGGEEEEGVKGKGKEKVRGEGRKNGDVWGEEKRGRKGMRGKKRT